MGIRWPCYRRPTAREIREAKEKATRLLSDSAPPWGATPITSASTGDVDMAEAREEPAATEAKKAGETAAAPTKEDENTVKPVLPAAADVPVTPVGALDPEMGRTFCREEWMFCNNAGLQRMQECTRCPG